jgi:hypothetical protein
MTRNLAATAGARNDPGTAVTALRRRARLGYRWAVAAFLLAGAAQIFLAGLGVFRLQWHGLAAAGDSAFAPHRALGFAMAGLALMILLLALAARLGTRAVIGSAVLVVLTSLMQSLLAGLADHGAIYGGLHALDGLLVLAIAGYLYAGARRHEL